MENTVNLYCDGGTIDKNPSPHGIVWAWIITDKKDTVILQTSSGFITNEELGLNGTNNIAEIIAAINGINYIKNYIPNTNFVLKLDSQITLGRLFKNWKLNNVPAAVQKTLTELKEFIRTYGKPYQLKGHPTNKEIQNHRNMENAPVSIYNVLCDDMCKRQATKFFM